MYMVAIMIVALELTIATNLLLKPKQIIETNVSAPFFSNVIIENNKDNREQNEPLPF